MGSSSRVTNPIRWVRDSRPSSWITCSMYSLAGPSPSMMRSTSSGSSFKDLTTSSTCFSKESLPTHMMALLPTRPMDSRRPSGSGIGWNMSVSTPAVTTAVSLGVTPCSASSSRMGDVNDTTASEWFRSWRRYTHDSFSIISVGSLTGM